MKGRFTATLMATTFLAALVLLAPMPATAQSANAGWSDTPSASNQLQAPDEAADAKSVGFLYETEALDLADIGASYVCPSESACTSNGTVFLDCAHLSCAPEDLACVGGDGSPCSGSCACYPRL